MIMNIGIIVFSVTGNTLSVAQKLQESLAAKGFTATLERITGTKEKPDFKDNSLKDAPDPSPYDTILFGSPVWAATLPPVMKAYLSQLPSLNGKKAGCFVTHSFPQAWMGGNHTAHKMKSFCESKGASVFAEGVVNWSGKNREQQIAALIETLTPSDKN